MLRFSKSQILSSQSDQNIFLLLEEKLLKVYFFYKKDRFNPIEQEALRKAENEKGGHLDQKPWEKWFFDSPLLMKILFKLNHGLEEFHQWLFWKKSHSEVFLLLLFCVDTLTFGFRFYQSSFMQMYYFLGLAGLIVGSALVFYWAMAFLSWKKKFSKTIENVKVRESKYSRKRNGQKK